MLLHAPRRLCCAAGSAPPGDSSPPPAGPSSHWPPPSAWQGADTAVRICTSRTCRQQGSNKLLAYVTSVARPAGVGVISSGCLGRCGDGPNAVFTPSGREANKLETKLAVLEALLANCAWRAALLEAAPAEQSED